MGPDFRLTISFVTFFFRATNHMPRLFALCCDERMNRPAGLAGYGRGLIVALLLAVTFLQSGCELFTTQQQLLKRSAQKLPSLQPSPDTIALRVTFIERPVGDPLLGKALWKEVDEFLSLEDPEYQKNLIKNGFRIGVLSSFSETLQELLKDDRTTEDQNSEFNFRGDNVYRGSGRPFLVNAGDEFPQCELNLFHTSTATPRESKALQAAKGIFEVVPIKEQEGWARLEFAPEFLHGAETLRPVAAATGWDGQYSQMHEKLHDLRFRLHMNEGDTAVITAQDNCPRTAGYYFFRGEGVNSSIQRALLVRLVRVPRHGDVSPQRNTLRLTSDQTELLRPVWGRSRKPTSGTVFFP